MKCRRKAGQGSFFAALLISLVAACLSSSLALGAAAPELLFQFPPPGDDQPGSGSGQFHNPRGVATDRSGEHVYIADLENNRVDVFSPWGEFRMAFGWGVADGTSAELQTCTTTCFAGIQGSGPGQLSEPMGVAVDSTGAIYVADKSNRVQKFTPSGEFVLMFGGEVNKTTGANVCTDASGNVCGAAVTGTEPGEFEGWGLGNFVSIGLDDTVYVGDKGRIQLFEPDGTYKSEIDLSQAINVEALAIDPNSGDIYFSYSQNPIDPHIYKLTSAGVSICTMSAERPVALAPDYEANLYAIDDPVGFGPPETEPIVRQFDSSCAHVVDFGRLPIFDNALTGIAANLVGDVYVAGIAFDTPTVAEHRNFVSVYGPPPSEIEPAPEKPATIAAQYASSVGATSGMLKAQINPHFFGATTYYVEYGTEDCSLPGSACAVTPAPPGAALNGGEREANITTSGISVSGLTPDTTYYFRFVAISGSFTTKGLGNTEAGPSGTFTTRRVTIPGLPDGRAYEKVSPADKNQGEAGVPIPPSGGAVENRMAKPVQATPAGEAITYTSFAAFGEAQGAAAASQYLSRRTGSGWATRNITPPARGTPLRDPLRGFTEDLQTGAVVQHDPPLVPDATPGVENLYLQDDATGALRLLTTEAPRLKEIQPTEYCVGYFGASIDASNVIFMARGALTPDAPESQDQNLYEWTADGLRLVSVLPDDTPAAPHQDTGFGAGAGTGGNCPVTNTMTNHAISADGSRIFWTFGGKYLTSERPLFARIEGQETVQLDAPQGGIGPGGKGRYWAASTDGSKVFFTDPNRLVAGSKPGDLYRYDFDAPAGETLSDITKAPAAAEVAGVLGASGDGSRIYFAAKGVLAPGAVKGERNLYLWVAGEGTRFIAILAGAGDVSNWGGTLQDPNGAIPEEQTARVAPDGHHLAFVSSASLTGRDNTDQETGEPDPEIYLYDADSNQLFCPSCNATGARPLGPSRVLGWTTPFQQPRYISDDGQKLFFESFDALVQRDTNGKRDVYEFERPGAGSCGAGSPTFSPTIAGCVDLISSGVSSDESYLLDASSDGRDVFISTRQKLLSSDTDERYDVYDARIGGGFPAAAPPPPPCSGEACRLPSTPTPEEATPPSSTFNGSGNVKPARKHHHKKRHRRHRKRRGRHHRKATRSAAR
jgi:DNA-binding beta-propeller fold protein YncE